MLYNLPVFLVFKDYIYSHFDKVSSQSLKIKTAEHRNLIITDMALRKGQHLHPEQKRSPILARIFICTEQARVFFFRVRSPDD
jgi:hypothetical protein